MCERGLEMADVSTGVDMWVVQVQSVYCGLLAAGFVLVTGGS